MIRTPTQQQDLIQTDIERIRGADQHSETQTYRAERWAVAYDNLHSEYLKLKAAFDKLESTHQATFCPNCQESLVDRCGCGHDPEDPEDCECDFCRSNREEDAEDQDIQRTRL